MAIDYIESEKLREDNLRKMWIRIIVFGSIGLILFIFLCMWAYPIYNVYSARKEGEAALAHATYSKEVQVAESKAKMEAASYEAQADTIRAHGVAKSNEIIGKSLRENKEYLNWLWINQLEKNQNAVIYIPTEANMPILEAGRLNKLKKKTLLHNLSFFITSNTG